MIKNALFGGSQGSSNLDPTEDNVSTNSEEEVNSSLIEGFEEINSVEEIEAPVEASNNLDLDEGFDEESYEVVDSEDCEEFFDCQEFPTPQNKTISYALKPLLYTTKYGAKVLSATTVVVSYTLNGTSYVIDRISYIPHGASKMLEKCKGEDENTVGYKITTASQNLLNFTSSAMYAASYVPHGAAVVLNGVSGVTGSVDSSLSPEKIEQICTKSDLCVDNLSSKLKWIKTENFSQALAIAS